MGILLVVLEVLESIGSIRVRYMCVSDLVDKGSLTGTTEKPFWNSLVCLR